MKLVIVESPNKCKKISKILGSGWIVKASVGHIRDLPNNDMGVDIENGFKPHYVISDDKKKVVSDLRNLAAKASTIYLAADADREGEAIAWHLKQVLKLGENYQRITFNEVTKTAILNAIQSPRRIDMTLVAAQETRRILDRLFGFSVSPELSNAAGINGLSGGRVQSPCTGLVVDREREINAFVSQDHYSAEITLDNGLKLTLDTEPFKNDDGLVLDPSVIDALLADLDTVTISVAEKNPSKSAPKGLFTTADLQQVASTKLGKSPSETAHLAQQLYQDGRITYIRTDDPNISDEGWEMVVAQLKADGVAVSDERRKWKAKDANAQEAHEGIRPTAMDAKPTGGSDVEQLYQLIYERALAVGAADGIDLASKVVATTEHNGQTIPFKASGKVVQQQGWRSLMTIETSEAKDTELPCLPDVGTECQVIEKGRKDQVTKPPARYTEATLSKQMEKCGIGRPATYASIFAVIFKREYVTFGKGRQIIPTELGNVVVDAMRELEFMNYAYTAELEEQLDKIAHGHLKMRDVVTPAWDQLESDLPKITIDQHQVKSFQEAIQEPCPKCSQPIKRLPKKDNPKQFFWVHVDEEHGEVCTKYIDDMRGKPYFAELQDHSCKLCGGKLERGYSTKNKSHFWTHADQTNCAKRFYDDRSGKPVIDAEACPGCVQPIKRMKSKNKDAKTGKFRYFWVHINGAHAETCEKYIGDEKGKPTVKVSS